MISARGGFPAEGTSSTQRACLRLRKALLPPVELSSFTGLTGIIASGLWKVIP
jgi:hypothetical protein